MINPSGGLQSPPLIGTRRPYLHITQLSPQINEVILRDIFSSAGPVVSAKVISDQQRQLQQGGVGYNYGFVEFADLQSAETAIQTLNGRRFFENEIRIDWANGASASASQQVTTPGSVSMYGGASGSQQGMLAGGMPMMPMDQQSLGSPTSPMRENTSNHFHIFVGDLSPEVNDAALRQAFQQFATLSEARVMWDITSGKSRGYGFVAFRERSDAEKAISSMNGEWLGSRAIRVNWANQKVQHGIQQQQGAGGVGLGMVGPPRSMGVAAALGGMGAIGLRTGSMPPTGGAASGTPITYDQALAGAPPHNTTVYVGNIPPFATQNDLIPLFSHYGYIVEIRMQAERGFAFVKLDTHENAASAIVNLAGQIACGRPIKCGWGKDRNESAMLSALRQGMHLSGYGNVGMYGIPQYGYPTGFTSAGQMTSPLDATTLQQMQAAQVQAIQAQAQAQAIQQQQIQQQRQQQQQGMGTSQQYQMMSQQSTQTQQQQQQSQQQQENQQSMQFGSGFQGHNQ